MDVAADIGLERVVRAVERRDILGGAIVDQPHRAAGKDAAVALEIGFPRRVGHFVGQGSGDVDRGGIQAVGDQRHATGEVVVDLLFGEFARVHHPLFEIAGEFVHLHQLIAQLDRRLAAHAQA